jgi:hypothetical protein
MLISADTSTSKNPAHLSFNLSLKEIDCEPGSDDSVFGDLLQRASQAC